MESGIAAPIKTVYRPLVEKALRNLESIWRDPDTDSLTRGEIMGVILLLREALE